MSVFSARQGLDDGWSLIPDQAPAVEPVTVESARTFIRADAGEDQFLASLVTAARVLVEARSGLALIHQDWTLWMDQWPGRAVVLPRRPASAVRSVSLRDADGVLHAVDAERYRVGLPQREEITAIDGSWPPPLRPDAGIAVAFTAGFGAEPDAVPAPLRQAILMLAAHWYENREAGASRSSAELPLGVAALLEPYRDIRL